MSDVYDAATEVCGPLKDIDSNLDRMYALMPTQRERIATAAMQALLSASFGESGYYIPSMIDADLTATVEQRLAHDAVAQADALIAALAGK